MIQFTWGAQTDRFRIINFTLGAQTDSFHKGAQMGSILFIRLLTFPFLKIKEQCFFNLFHFFISFSFSGRGAAKEK